MKIQKNRYQNEIIFLYILYIANNLKINESYMKIAENYIDRIYFASIIKKIINNKL